MDSRTWDERYAAADLVWGLEPNRWVARETAGLPPGRALDLAAGEGRNALWLAGRGWRVTAVDFSEVALERGRRRAEKESGTAGRLTWLRADVLSYDPEPGAYDLVVVAYLQLPADQRRTVLRRAAGAAAPGGSLLVVGHDSTNLTDGTGGPQDPEVLFGPDDVLDDVAAAGLRTLRADRVRRPVAGASADAIDALVLLRRDGPPQDSGR